jgi:hypothetical protein
LETATGWMDRVQFLVHGVQADSGVPEALSTGIKRQGWYNRPNSGRRKMRKQYALPKRRYVSTRLHGGIPQKDNVLNSHSHEIQYQGKSFLNSGIHNFVTFLRDLK